MCLSVGHHLLVSHADDSSVFHFAYSTRTNRSTGVYEILITPANTAGIFQFTVSGMCPGTPICNNRGSCLRGQCCCAVGWDGESCDVPLSRSAVTLGNCSCPRDHVCNQDGKCVCTRKFERAGICSRDSCPFQKDSCGVCSGHGDCVNGKCVCDVDFGRNAWSNITGWAGEDCSTPVTCPFACHNELGHGKCDVSTGKCVCSAGFTGVSCDVTTCPGNVPCNGNGVCQSNGTCACAAEFKGDACESRRCIGGCLSGKCVNGECVCAPHWSGAHCDVPESCPSAMHFSNCTDATPRKCGDLGSQKQLIQCVPGCACPAERPLWDEPSQKCVSMIDCSGTCWGQLTPNPHEVLLEVTPQRNNGSSEVAHVCTYHPFRVCYKAGLGLLDPHDDGALIAHSRKYHAPIGIVVYDEHGNRIPEDWSKAPLEDNGHISGSFGAEGGFAVMSIRRFGFMEIRYFVIGPSSTSPIFLAKKKIFSSDCDTSVQDFTLPPTPMQCIAPTVLENGSINCNGATVGSTCRFGCSDGYVLSNPTSSHLTCVGSRGHSGSWSAPAPSCIALRAAKDCSIQSRDGQLCTPLVGDVATGICHNSVCAAVTASAFCARAPPAPTGTGCVDAGCDYRCNGANSECHIECANGAKPNVPSAVCSAGVGGGWWNNLWTGSCI